MHSSWFRREMVIALLLVAVSVVNLAGGDTLSALVWGLLAVSSVLYSSAPGQPVRGLRDMDWTPRNIAAALAALVALVIIMARIAADFSG